MFSCDRRTSTGPKSEPHPMETPALSSINAFAFVLCTLGRDGAVCVFPCDRRTSTGPKSEPHPMETPALSSINRFAFVLCTLGRDGAVCVFPCDRRTSTGPKSEPHPMETPALSVILSKNPGMFFQTSTQKKHTQVIYMCFDQNVEWYFFYSHGDHHAGHQ